METAPGEAPERKDKPTDRLQDELVKALDAGNIERFCQLLESPKVDPGYRYGKPHFGTCLEIACRREWGGDFVRALLRKVKPNVNRIVPEPVHHAAKRGHDDVLAALLGDKRTKANAIDSWGFTALHYACVNVTARRVEEYEHCVELLMDKFAPADVNRADGRGYTAVHKLAVAPKRKQKRQGGGKARRADAQERADSEADDEDADAQRGARLRLADAMMRLGGDVLDLDSARAYGRTARDELLLRFPELKGKLPLPLRAERADPHAALIDAMRDGHLDNFCALLQQTDADGNPTMDPNHWFAAPLHATCLELACQKENGAEFVRALVAAGADPNMPNQHSEKCPVHVACEAGSKEILDALLDNEESHARLDCVDKLGNTALHAVVAVPAMDDGRKACLEKLLARSDFPMNKLNRHEKSALRVALDNKNRDAVFLIVTRKAEEVDVGPKMREEILKEFPDMNADLLRERPDKRQWLCDDGGICGPKLMNLLKIKHQNEFSKRFCEAESERKRRLVNYQDNQNTLLQCAARYGLEEAVFVLLREGAQANLTFPKNPSPPIVLASQCDSNNVLKIFLDHAPDVDIDATDARGNTALHHASRRINLDGVILLLQHGADWRLKNVMGKTAFLKKDMRALLDKCVRTNDKAPHAEDYEIVLDYRLVALPPRNERYVPPGRNHVSEAKEMLDMLGEDSSTIALQPALESGDVQGANMSEPVQCEMNFLSILSKSKYTNDLVQHPVAASFLDLKWQRVKIFAYLNLLMYAFFIVVLNTHIVYNSPKLWSNETEESSVSLESFRDDNSTDPETRSSSLRDMVEKPVTYFLLLILLMLFCLREVVQCLGDFKNYFTNFENVLDWATLLSTWAVLFLPDFSNRRTLNVLAIMLSCTGLLLLTGRISKFARNIEMLKVVLVNYLMTLVSYIIILYAFAISFYTLFKVPNPTPRDEEQLPFQTMTLSLMKVIVMMTGELEAGDIPLQSSVVGAILFVLFVALVTIVLLNLLIGLAVSDIQEIQDDAEKLKMRSRVQMVAEIEGIVVHVLNRRWLPRRWRVFFCRVLLFPPWGETRQGTVRPNQKPPFELSGTDGVKVNLNTGVLNSLTTLLSERNKCRRRSLHDVLDEVLGLLKDRPAFSRAATIFGSNDDIRNPLSRGSSFRSTILSYATSHQGDKEP